MKITTTFAVNISPGEALTTNSAALAHELAAAAGVDPEPLAVAARVAELVRSLATAPCPSAAELYTLPACLAKSYPSFARLTSGAQRPPRRTLALLLAALEAARTTREPQRLLLRGGEVQLLAV